MIIKQIYIVDYDSIFVFVLKKLLEKHQGFGKVVDIKNGNESLELFFDEKTGLPCVILLDLNMPLID